MRAFSKFTKIPDSFSVEKACVLQDSNQSRICAQKQNLFSASILGLIKDGCAVKQLGLSWQDQLHFVLHDDFSMHGIQMHDEILEQAKSMKPETGASAVLRAIGNFFSEHKSENKQTFRK